MYNKEKFINFVVGDIIRNTPVIKGLIEPPYFSKTTWIPKFRFHRIIHLNNFEFRYGFFTYIRKLYGVPRDLYEDVVDVYKERMRLLYGD
jgi:hypothetical protein